MLELSLVQKIAIWALPLIFAITLHEVAHGFVASWFGDQTARLSGRLSLNPAKHIDPLGTIVLPLLMLVASNFVFGWAKPVPVDARNLHHPRRDLALVAAAGPIMNLLMAFIWGWIGKGGMALSHAGYAAGLPLFFMGNVGIMINVVLAVLNIIPLPPLDGGKVLASLLPPRIAYHFSKIEPYGFFILLLLLVTGILSAVMGPIVYAIVNFISDLTIG